MVLNINILNFRDLGGYKNNEGKQVKYGHIFRSSPIVFKDETFYNRLLSVLDINNELHENTKTQNRKILKKVKSKIKKI